MKTSSQQLYGLEVRAVLISNTTVRVSKPFGLTYLNSSQKVSKFPPCLSRENTETDGMSGHGQQSLRCAHLPKDDPWAMK